MTNTFADDTMIGRAFVCQLRATPDQGDLPLF